MHPKAEGELTSRLAVFERMIASIRANGTIYFLILCLLVAAGINILVVTERYYFFSDDFLNFILYREMGPTWHYFVRDFTGEFVPLLRVANLVYFKLFRLHFLPVRLLVIIYQWSIILLIAAMGLRGRVRIEILAPALVLVAVSPIFATLYQWWSAALNTGYGGLASLGSIYVMSLDGMLSQRRKLAGSMLYLAGLLLFPKCLVVAVLIFFVRLFIQVSHDVKPGRSAVFRALADVWPIVPIAGLYVAIVLFGQYKAGVTVPGSALFFAYIWEAWAYGFGPGVLGFAGRFAGSDAVAALLVIGVVAAAVVRRPQTWLLWAGFGIYFVISLGIIAMNRSVLLGLESATTPRYFADILPYFIALSMLAFSNSQNNAGNPQPWQTGVTLGASALAAAFLIAAGWSVPLLWERPWRIKLFVEHAQISLAQTAANVKVADTIVPDWVMPAWTWPQSQMMSFMQILTNPRKVVSPEDAGWRFNDSGDLVRIDDGITPRRFSANSVSGASAVRTSSQTACFLDRADGRAMGDGVIAADRPMRVKGWGVFDTKARIEPGQIALAFQAANGTIYAVEAMPVPRPDVAAVYGLAKSDHVGFGTVANVLALPPGDYNVILIMQAADEQRACATKRTVKVSDRE